MDAFVHCVVTTRPPDGPLPRVVPEWVMPPTHQGRPRDRDRLNHSVVTPPFSGKANNPVLSSLDPSSCYIENWLVPMRAKGAHGRPGR